MRDGIPRHKFEVWKKFAETEPIIRKEEARVYIKKIIKVNESNE